VVRRATAAGIAAVLVVGGLLVVRQSGADHAAPPSHGAVPSTSAAPGASATQLAAFATTMLRSIPKLPGARPSRRPPSEFFRGPPTRPGVGPLIVRSQFWTIHASWREVRRQVISRMPAQFRGRFYTTIFSPSYTDSSSNGHWFLRQRPPTIAHAEVEPLVAPISRRTTGLGLYALTVAQPARPAAERVPYTAGVELTLQPRFDQPEVRQGPVTGPDATVVIQTLNHLKVSTENGPFYRCTALTDGIHKMVFSTAHHTWVANLSKCGTTQLTIDGRRLPGLEGLPYLPQPFAQTFWIPTH
jgi:hypothetical protein